jgi:hypothetical protein
MPLTRRDILRFAGAATAGIVFSPLPWKMLDDVAIWTQTGPWIPKVPRGPISHVPTLCSLCPAGCPVTARCVAGAPSALRTASGSGQPLCPIGLTSHHLAYHPLRLEGPCLVEHRGEKVLTTDISLDGALRRLPSVDANRSVMFVDQRPGRAISDRYRAFVRQHPGSLYAVPDDDASLRTVGFDLDRARTILSVSTPLLDGWTTPARTARLMLRRSQNDGLRIIAADAARTRTASLADRWMPIRPGSEAALLVALLHLAHAHRRADMTPSMRAIVERSTPERMAAAIGIVPAQLRHVYAKLTEHGPSLVVVGGDGCNSVDAETEHLAFHLNHVLGALSSGAIRRRPAIPVSEGLHERDLAVATPLSSVPEASVDLVILDGDEGTCHLSWESIARTLRPGSPLVVSLSPVLTSLASHADLIIPSPAPFESFGEATGDGTDVSCKYGLSRPLHPRRPGSVDPEVVLGHLSGQPIEREATLRAKVDGIWSSRRGQICMADGSTNDLTSLDGAESLWTLLTEGAVWRLEGGPAPSSVRALATDGAASERLAARLTKLEAFAATPTIAVIPTWWAPVTSCSRLSPLMTKLYQESGLRPTSEVAAVAPATAHACGVEDGSVAELRAGERSSAVKVRVSDSLAPGTVQLSVGPDPVGFRSPEPPSVANAVPRGRAAELRKS